ncbi:hypothetical protein H0G72_04615 [Liberibacter sp. Z1]|nr:hypothetical protein [Candidatus Liberibacter sp.]
MQQATPMTESDEEDALSLKLYYDLESLHRNLLRSEDLPIQPIESEENPLKD